MAAMTGATVIGIDLTPEFVETARLISDRVGLGRRTEFRTTAGESMPLDDGSFDAAVMVHVGALPPREAGAVTSAATPLALPLGLPLGGTLRPARDGRSP